MPLHLTATVHTKASCSIRLVIHEMLPLACNACLGKPDSEHSPTHQLSVQAAGKGGFHLLGSNWGKGIGICEEHACVHTVLGGRHLGTQATIDSYKW